MAVSTFAATLAAMALLSTPAAAPPLVEAHAIPSCEPGCVVDLAGILTEEQEQALSARLREIRRVRESKRGPRYEAIYAGLVVIEGGPDDLDGYAQRALQRWEFGRQGVAIVIDPARGAVGIAAGETYRPALATQQAADARRTLASAQVDGIASGLEQLIAPVQAIARRNGESKRNLQGGLLLAAVLLVGIPVSVWRMRRRYGR